MLFVGTLEGEVCRWDLKGWQAYLEVEYVPGGLDAPEPAMVFPPRRMSIYSKNDHETRFRLPLQVFGSHANAIRCMTYHEGKLYTGSLDGKVMQWDAKSGEKMHTFELPALPPTGC